MMKEAERAKKEMLDFLKKNESAGTAKEDFCELKEKTEQAFFVSLALDLRERHAHTICGQLYYSKILSRIQINFRRRGTKAGRAKALVSTGAFYYFEEKEKREELVLPSC